MIYPETKLNIADNSGAKLAKCIKVLNFSKRKGAKPGSLIVVSIKKAKTSKTVTKGSVCRGVLVRAKKLQQRNTGLSIKFSNNSLILVDQKNIPIASRIIGPIYKELRNKNYPKLVMLAKTII